MNKNQPNLAALASLAHKALNADDTEYTLAKNLISQFFRSSAAVAHKEEVRLTLIDSWFSTNVAAKRLFGISDLAEKLRGVFPNGDDELKAQAAQWIDSGFNSEKLFRPLFAAKNGFTKKHEEGEAADSLLSKYLYFATGCAFPIYDSLGAKHFSIAKRKAPKDAQKRFRVLQEIMNDNKIAGFDQLDNLFWLYGKVSVGSFSLVLNKTRYTELNKHMKEKNIEDMKVIINEDAAKLQNILGADLCAFIQKSAALDKEQ
jgi:hypothetical protein